MKILYMSHILSIHDFRFLEKLSLSNHDVLLVAIDNSEIPKSISSIFGLKHIVIPRPLPKNNFKYYLSFRAIILSLRHGIYRIIEKFSYFKSYFSETTKISHQEFRFFFYRTKILQIIKKFKPDVLHAGWVQLDGLVAELTGFRPILQMPWGSDILTLPFNSEQILMQTKFVLNGATQITCDCEKVKKTIIDLVNYDKDKITVMPWGIDLKLFNPERKNRDIIKKLDWQDKRIIIMTRSFNEIYGIHFFLMALPKIIKSEGRVKVLLVGTGPLEEDLKEIVNSLDLDQYVHFVGSVPNDHLAYYLNSAEVYVSTSKSDGSSNSLLEAMACWLPVVVSDVPAILEWVKDGENGYVVPRNKVKPISDKIILLLKDKQTAQRMGKSNFCIAQEKADWDKNYLKLEKIYRDMTKPTE
jgi:glycosyltransferase involved in cell wall biosynthesis